MNEQSLNNFSINIPRRLMQALFKGSLLSLFMSQKKVEMFNNLMLKAKNLKLYSSTKAKVT